LSILGSDLIDLCWGSAEVGNHQKCKRQKRRRMPRFLRNAKVPTGAEERIADGIGVFG